MIITIDGPAGVGKSSMAKGLATAFGFAYLDTGAMYRYIGYTLGAKVTDMTDEVLEIELKKYEFTLQHENDLFVLYCNGKSIGDEIRSDKAGRMAAVVATLPLVRKTLQKYQRKIAGEYSIVVEGRDMGTVVFPHAKVKFFLDANLVTRAKRRFLEMREKGMESDYDNILSSMELRDLHDRERNVDPLRAADDAFLVDTSAMDQCSVLANMVRHVIKIQELQQNTTPQQKTALKQSITPCQNTLTDHEFSHLDKNGHLRMVAVEEKKVTLRKALAGGFVQMNAETIRLLKANALPKGDILTVAKIAGIMGAKQTAHLIPLCHPLLLSFIDVDFTVHENGVEIISEVRTHHNTGVEMEAILAVQIAAATIYDMAKAVQKDMVIENIRLLYKEGGKNIYNALR